MARLLIDIGNSCIKAATADMGKISPLVTISSKKLLSVRALHHLLVKQSHYELIGYCSVNIKWDRVIRNLARKLKTPLKQIDHELTLPLPSTIEHPEKAGSDLRLYGYSAVAQGHDNAIIIALGTASTITVIHHGKMEGAVISCGLYSSLTALTTSAPAIIIKHIEYQKQLIGKNTQEAINAGVVNIYGYGLKAAITQLLLTNEETAIILTGGNAPLLHDFLEQSFTISYQPLILFEGLNRIINEQSPL